MELHVHAPLKEINMKKGISSLSVTLNFMEVDMGSNCLKWSYNSQLDLAQRHISLSIGTCKLYSIHVSTCGLSSKAYQSVYRYR